MFFKRCTSTRPVIQVITEFHKINHLCSMHCFSTNGLLFIDIDEDKKQTQLYLFDLDTNRTKMCKVLDKPYRFIGHLANTHLILKNLNSDDLLILETRNFEIANQLTHQLCINPQLLGLVEFKAVTAVKTENTMNQEEGAFHIVMHDLQSMIFDSIVSVPIPMDHPSYQVGPLVKLANGHFACSVTGDNSDYFKVILFKKISNEHLDFRVIGVINPTKQHNNSSSSLSAFVGLPDGNVLTYHASGLDFQIWKGTECIERWSWRDIQCSDKLFTNGFWTNGVFPLPDSEHLVILASHVNLFLFNMRLKTMKIVQLQGYYPQQIEVCTNGQVIIRATQDLKKYVLLLVDFKEILEYRTTISNLIREKGLPDELCSHIFSYIAPGSSWSTEQDSPRQFSCTIS
ncbi:hypothetical protein [Legionella quateirensis]|uniref:Uncharacterized protein n=1 Tax=Legionella quateirensis TaxID=45072 RepID=A0A378KTW8_9GAMM|nr:hypothetical protein [Legionella quateirensis]KTD43381.1 hypothetical protein Lqua_3282 [Legionella quateirensis]STY18264.1 Uncharacterised protein [Legionella quateirensis]